MAFMGIPWEEQRTESSVFACDKQAQPARAALRREPGPEYRWQSRLAGALLQNR
jgi:hypothetical protein